MMGRKERSFAPLIQVSLEDLVPADHFYRHLERSLDLSFVREFVQQSYANGGRPSIDPTVFWHRCNWSCFLREYAPNGN
jgi:transposase